MNILDFPGFRPVLDCFDFVRGHEEAVGREDVSQILYCVLVELTLFSFGIEAMLAEMVKNLVDMFAMFSRVARVDKDIIKIDYNTYIEEVLEDVVHEMLESSRGISKTKGHH